MEIRQLKTFQAVADLLSFHRAAGQLHYAQSTVSAQIMALEEELGVRLFERLGRRVLITPAGEELYQYARKMLDLETEARAQLSPQAQAAGSLTIRAPESLCVHRLAPAVARFRQAMPRVQLHLITCAHEGLQRDLRQGVTDLAFLYADSLAAGDLKAEMLGVEELCLVGPAGHPLTGPGPLDPARLAGETLLLSRVDCSYRRLLAQVMEQEGIKPAQVLEMNSVAAIMAWVEAGLGISLLPRMAAAPLVAQGRLGVIPWPEEGLEVACLMIHHRDKWISPALDRFMEYARELLVF